MGAKLRPQLRPAMFSFIWGWICFFWTWGWRALYTYALLSLLTYVSLYLWDAFKKPQNLKSKYNAQWAIVTGASSGIGRAITEKLAEQGVNVVMVAYPDALLEQFHQSISQKYSSLTFVKVSVDMGQPTWMGPVIEATKEITPTLIFSNAGYISFGLFTELPLDKQIAYIETNATAGVRLSHHFVRKMRAANLRGCVCFTSSPAGMVPSPCSALYGATKIFLTEFAASIAGELQEDGIDVLVLNPSPVDTNFYAAQELQKNQTLQFFKRLACPPTTIADAMFASVGTGSVVRDQGFITFCLHLLTKVLDFNMFAFIQNKITRTTAEYKSLKEAAASRKKDE